jgi:rod shape-determining protein MreD
MNRNASHRILAPARYSYILLTLAIALMLNMLPFDNLSFIPDFAVLVLIFWCVQQPQLISMGIAFVIGILSDVAYSSFLGQHALSYVIIAFLANLFSKRIIWFPLFQQGLHIFPLLLLGQIILYMVGSAAGAATPSIFWFIQSFISTMLWAPLTFLLLLPQFQSTDRDDVRPI